MTSAHMKSEAKTKFSSGEGRKSFRSWPRRTNGQRFVERASAPSSLGFARRQPSPRIHSTVRFGERSQAHMGDSELGCCFSLEASSFSAKLLSLCTSLPGPRSLGSCRARGPASYGDCRAPRVQAEGLGLSRLPGSAAAAASLEPGGAGLDRSSRPAGRIWHGHPGPARLQPVA